MADGRVFRKIEDQWQAVGAPLPVWDHVPPTPNQPVNVWVLPKGDGYQSGDVVAFGETGHRLLSLVPPDDVAWNNVIESALAIHSADHVREWIAQIDLWLGIRLAAAWR